MYTISIVNQKGGSGKSTIATCLAIAAHEDGMASAILDMDPQGTCYQWAKRREDPNPPVLSVTNANYIDEWQRLKDAGAGLVIIDTPARLQDTVLNAADLSDLIIVPSKTTIKDIERVRESIKLVCANGPKPAVVVLNQVRPQGSRSEDAETAIRAQGYPVCPARIGVRVAFEDADLTGQTPLEIEPEGKAAEELQSLWRYMKGLLKQVDKGPLQDADIEKATKRAKKKGKAIAA